MDSRAVLPFMWQRDLVEVATIVIIALEAYHSTADANSVTLSTGSVLCLIYVLARFSTFSLWG